MEELKFAENLARLRKSKNITQEKLADFMGVTKASVSKWETKQSLPDVLLLPRLASFFDQSVDELLGYAPQLTKEQIQSFYRKWSADFAELELGEVMSDCREKVKQYYSCYPFLFQVAVLWLNHFMLAKSTIEQQRILAEASDLCSRIMEEATDLTLCNNASLLKAAILMQQGDPEAAIDLLAPLEDPYQLAKQSDTLLIQAYQAAGKMEQAIEYSQFSLVTHLSNILANSTNYLLLKSTNREIIQETIKRTEQLIDVFHLDHLNPNNCAQFYFSSAYVYSQNEEMDLALACLDKFVGLTCELLDRKQLMDGDDYFDQLEKVFEQSDLGTEAVRNKKLIRESALQALDIPVFSTFATNKKFLNLKKELAGGSCEYQ